MHSEYPRRGTSVTVWLVAVMIAAFIVELILLSPWMGSGEILVSQLTLTIRNLQQWHVWTLATHGILHSPGNPFHLLFMLLTLVFVGRELEPLLGAKKFLGVFASAVICGGLAWAAVHWTHGGMHVGATAGVLGLFVVLACLYPNQQISFLVLFLFPVTLRPKYFVYGLLALDVFGLIFYELLGAAAPFNYSPSTHLGGMLAGWIYYRFVHASNGWDRAPGIGLPAWLTRRSEPKPTVKPTSALPSGKPRAGFRAEVDRILDKINSQGFGALTEEEKRVLDEAKDLLSKP
jgi:membrane associated rhomboid family serine protease